MIFNWALGWVYVSGIMSATAMWSTSILSTWKCSWRVWAWIASFFCGASVVTAFWSAAFSTLSWCRWATTFATSQTAIFTWRFSNRLENCKGRNLKTNKTLIPNIIQNYQDAKRLFFKHISYLCVTVTYHCKFHFFSHFFDPCWTHFLRFLIWSVQEFDESQDT